MHSSQNQSVLHFYVFGGEGPAALLRTPTVYAPAKQKLFALTLFLPECGEPLSAEFLIIGDIEILYLRRGLPVSGQGFRFC